MLLSDDHSDVDRCVLNLNDFSFNKHLPLACWFFHLLVSQVPALFWNYPKERFTSDRMKGKARSVHFCWGMKALRSFRVTAQSNHLSFLWRANFSWSHTVQQLAHSRKPITFPRLHHCVIVFLCMCMQAWTSSASISMAIMSQSAKHLLG